MSFIENIKCDLCGEEHHIYRTTYVVLYSGATEVRHVCKGLCLSRLRKFLVLLCIPYVLEPSKRINIPPGEYAGRIEVRKVKDE